MSKWPGRLLALSVLAVVPACLSEARPHHYHSHGGASGVIEMFDALAELTVTVATLHDEHEQRVAAQRAEREATEAERDHAPPPYSAPDGPPDLTVDNLPPAPPPRGFYCSTSPRSPAVSVCTRDARACDDARDEAAVTTPDLPECTRLDHAWCFAAYCYASRAACNSHRGPDSIGDCFEQR